MKSIISLVRPEFEVTKIEEINEETGFSKVKFDFPTYKLVSRFEKYLVDEDEVTPIPFTPFKTSRGNEGRKFNIEVSKGNVAEVYVETIPNNSPRGGYPTYVNFMKTQDAPKFMSTPVDAEGDELEVFDL